MRPQVGPNGYVEDDTCSNSDHEWESVASASHGQIKNNELPMLLPMCIYAIQKKL